MIRYLSILQQLSKFLLIFRFRCIDKIDKIWNLSKIISNRIKGEIDKHTTVIIKFLLYRYISNNKAFIF